MIARYGEAVDGVDVETVDDALTMLRRASRLVRALDRFFAARGFSQLRFLILIVIDREPEADGLSPSAIADRLDVSRPVLTRTLQALERDGLIALAVDDQDNRAKRVRLTPDGAARLHALLPDYFALLQKTYRADAA